MDEYATYFKPNSRITVHKADCSDVKKWGCMYTVAEGEWRFFMEKDEAREYARNEVKSGKARTMRNCGHCKRSGRL